MTVYEIRRYLKQNNIPTYLQKFLQLRRKYASYVVNNKIILPEHQFISASKDLGLPLNEISHDMEIYLKIEKLTTHLVRYVKIPELDLKMKDFIVPGSNVLAESYLQISKKLKKQLCISKKKRSKE